MARSNGNLHKAKKEKNDELTPSQKANKKYYLKHRKQDCEYFAELRYSTDGWIPIKGYEDYEINTYGCVYFKGCYSSNGIRRKPRFIKQTLMSNGYYAVSLNRNKVYLHRIIAETFIPNPENKPEIDHIDGNPQNNNIYNLRWATHKENLNNPVSVNREISSHLGLVSNIKGRKKVWIDRDNNKFKMV